MVDGSSLKLDVWFEFDGSADLEFWNTSIEGIEGRKPLTDKLMAINLLNEFNDDPGFKGNGYHKNFKIGDTYKSMIEVDNAVIAFVKNLMQLLKQS